MKEFFSKVWNAIKNAFQTKAWLKWVAIGAAVVITGGIVFGVVSCSMAGGSSSGSSSQSSIEDSSSSEEEIFNYMYRVKVQTMDGYGLSGITVHLYNGDAEVTSLKTNSSGKATFMDNILPNLGQYTIKLTDLPVGYKLADESAVYKTEAIKGMDIEIPLMPTGVIQEAAPANKVYKLGDVMYDFSLRRADGSNVALSQILQEKDMVFLNFWALRCAPCKQEFPYMNLTYISFYDEEEEIKYSDKIEILALNNEDTQSNIDTYKNTNSFQFEMLNDYASGANLTKHFDLGAIPVSAIVDRYGVIVSLHTGNLTSVSQFQSIFNPFIGEDYTPKILSNDSETGGGDTEEEEIRIKPTVSNPAESDIKTALGNDSFTYLWDKDEYSWPWLVGEKDGEKYIYSSNKGVDNSYAILYMNFTATANTALCFDLKMETEVFGVGLDGDFFYVILDNTQIHKINGTKDWTTFCAYAFNEFEAGEHELAILYQKDGETSAGEDMVMIKNLRFESFSALNSDPTVDSYIIRQAATVKNLDEGATTQFKNYITPVLNETDGYYHVNSADGPVLYANVLGSTSFSMYSIYDLARAGYSISEGFDLSDNIGTMAWEATYNYFNYGYTPVTEQWKELLDEFVYCTTYTQLWGGEWHENEWLELCVYYDHYGDTPIVEDPLKGITCNAAIPITVGTTTVDVPFEMIPRGFKYKFIPTESGVYNIYSTSDSDTLCFLTDERVLDFSINGIYNAESRDYMLGEFSASIYSDDGDFNFHYYFEAGKTYYLWLCYFSPTETGSYDVTIEYAPENNRELTAAGTTISFDEESDTGDFYVLDGVDFAYDETDGYYKVKNADGSLGSILYVDTARPIWYFGGNGSLNNIANGAQTNFQLLIDNVDYTDDLKALCQQGADNTEMPGFVAMTQEVYELLVTLTQGQDEAVENDWLLMCYYWKTLG